MCFLERVLARTETPDEYDSVLRHIAENLPHRLTPPLITKLVARPEYKVAKPLPTGHILKVVPAPRPRTGTEVHIKSLGPSQDIPMLGGDWEGFGQIRIVVGRRVTGLPS